MLTVLETVQDYKIEILGKGNFRFQYCTPSCMGRPDGIGWDERADWDGRQGTAESGKANTGQDC